jgi:hypothetical protein
MKMARSTFRARRPNQSVSRGELRRSIHLRWGQAALPILYVASDWRSTSPKLLALRNDGQYPSSMGIKANYYRGRPGATWRGVIWPL